jgi:hypothetical protein
MNLDNIQPMIVPRSYGTKMPHIEVGNKNFVVCWVHCSAESLAYILEKEFNELNNFNPNWKRIATDNLRKGDYFQKYTETNSNGELIMLCFINDLDAISSSKILLSPELNRIFPEGYWVATPNRVVGYVISKKSEHTHLLDYIEKIEYMYNAHRNGSFHSKEIFEPSQFKLPDDILEPIDIQNFEDLIDFVLKNEKEDD